MLDQATRDEMARLSENLQALDPDFFPGLQYEFSGDESLTYDEAMKLMEQTSKNGQTGSSRSKIRDSTSLQSNRPRSGQRIAGRTFGPKIWTPLIPSLNYWRKPAISAGKTRNSRLTPRGMRKIGEKALSSVFSRLKKDRLGQHNIQPARQRRRTPLRNQKI